MRINMTKTEKEIQDELLNKTFDKLRKEGLIVDVVGQDGIVTMLTAKGFEQHRLLSLFAQPNQTGSVNTNEKTKKSGQEKMDSAIKTMVTIGAGISQMMQGLGGLAGDPVKMDMSQAGIDFGQNKPKKKQTHKKGKPRRKKR
jgi:hypothetical protein